MSPMYCFLYTIFCWWKVSQLNCELKSSMLGGPIALKASEKSDEVDSVILVTHDTHASN